MKNQHYCIECKTPLTKAVSIYKGIRLDSLQCPRCKRKVFDEERAMKAARRIDAAKLKKEYKKDIIKIGHSLAITIPKDLTDFFEMEGKTVTLLPDAFRKRIEIRIA